MVIAGKPRARMRDNNQQPPPPHSQCLSIKYFSSQMQLHFITNAASSKSHVADRIYANLANMWVCREWNPQTWIVGVFLVGGAPQMSNIMKSGSSRLMLYGNHQLFLPRDQEYQQNSACNQTTDWFYMTVRVCCRYRSWWLQCDGLDGAGCRGLRG